jgi:hypothetical protein
MTLAAAVAAACFTISVPEAQAQISLDIGAAPDCPYGYYDYSPYACAPSGYYGPAWFEGGIFMGAGPWFHGPEGWRGHVDNHYDGRHGYEGPFPHRGEPHDPVHHTSRMAHFSANEMRDGHGGGGEHFAGGGHESGGHEGGGRR